MYEQCPRDELQDANEDSCALLQAGCPVARANADLIMTMALTIHFCSVNVTYRLKNVANVNESNKDQLRPKWLQANTTYTIIQYISEIEVVLCLPLQYNET